MIGVGQWQLATTRSDADSEMQGINANLGTLSLQCLTESREESGISAVASAPQWLKVKTKTGSTLSGKSHALERDSFS